MSSKKMPRAVVTIFVLVLSVITISCVKRHKGETKTGILSYFVSITDNEDRGIKAILKEYGGKCKYSIGYKTSTESGRTKYFEIEESESPLLDQITQDPDKPASDIAYLFYSNLAEERSKYDEVIVTFQKDGKHQEFAYPIRALHAVETKMPVVLKLVNYLKTSQYDTISNLLLPGPFSNAYSREMKLKFPGFKSQYGEIKEVSSFGFAFKTTSEGRDIVQIFMAIKWEKGNTAFTADLPVEEGNDKVLFFDFSY